MELIDHVGEIWPGDIHELAEELQSSLSGDELVNFLVRNLGWVLVEQKQGVCKIKCRPSSMSETTLVALLFCVHDCSETTVFALDIVSKDSVSQLVRGKYLVTTILSSLVDAAGARDFWKGAKFIASRLTKSAPPFASIANKIKTLIERADDIGKVAPHISQLLQTRWSISSYDRTSGDWIEDFNSGGFTPFNPAYSGRQSGARLSEYAADAEYTHWIARCRHRVIEDNSVDLATVDAIVTFARVGEARLRYHRICLPVKRRNGSTSIFMAAQTDPSIDLRRQCA